MSDSDDLDDGWGDEPAEPPSPPKAPAVKAPLVAQRRNTPDRATMPPPMPEQAYIEQILATEEVPEPPPRKRLNTLVERDPLQYDAAVPDENTRPTKPPASAVAASDVGEDFLDLSLGELSGDRASASDVLLSDPTGAALRPPPAPTLEPSRDSFDDLPIDDVLESLAPESMSGRALSVPPPSNVRGLSARPGAVSRPSRGPAAPVPAAPKSPAPGLRPPAASPAARPAAPQPAAPSPSPAVAPPVVAPLVAAAPKARPAYDSSPTIEVVEVGSARLTPSPLPAVAAPQGGDALDRDLEAPPAALGAAQPRPRTAPRGSMEPSLPAGRPPERPTPVQGVESVAAALSRAGGRGASTRPALGAVTPPAGTPASGPHLGSGPPGARSTERPTRALLTPIGAAPVDAALEKVVERFDVGDFGRALMLAEQAIASGSSHEDLQHYAELCREKLRQTYVDRIGSGRTILKVSVDPEKLRERSLDPRLAFLLSLLDGASSIDDVVDMSSMPALDAVRALHELLQEGVVEVVEGSRRLSLP